MVLFPNLRFDLADSSPCFELSVPFWIPFPSHVLFYILISSVLRIIIFIDIHKSFYPIPFFLDFGSLKFYLSLILSVICLTTNYTGLNLSYVTLDFIGECVCVCVAPRPSSGHGVYILVCDAKVYFFLLSGMGVYMSTWHTVLSHACSF